MKKSCFDIDCKSCPRLTKHFTSLRKKYPDYHNAPVAPFGVAQPRLLIVGLAPGLHGANATGRPFTGDYAGILLYETLHKFKFSNQANATARNDGLKLFDCRISNAVKCLPPENKPTTEEVNNCNTYLAAELATLKPDTIVLALGGISHKAIIKAFGLKQSAFKFAHMAEHTLPNKLTLIDSYHCSRYNTSTKRLTEKMFHAVFARIKQLMK